MYKVLLKDQYTSGYAKKIAGSYTLVAGFLIHQYMCQYTCCILKELGGILMLCGRYVYGILTFVAGFLIHQYVSVYIWYTDGFRRCTDVVWEVRTYTGFLHS